MRRKVVLSALAALLGAIALAGCGSSASSTGVTSAKDRVVVGYYADWDMYVRGFPIYLPLSAHPHEAPLRRGAPHAPELRLREGRLRLGRSCRTRR